MCVIPAAGFDKVRPDFKRFSSKLSGKVSCHKILADFNPNISS
jgi:hypothetical protein